MLTRPKTLNRHTTGSVLCGHHASLHMLQPFFSTNHKLLQSQLPAVRVGYMDWSHAPVLCAHCRWAAHRPMSSNVPIARNPNNSGQKSMEAMIVDLLDQSIFLETSELCTVAPDVENGEVPHRAYFTYIAFVQG